MRRLWVVLVTEGRRLRFAPEVYPTQLRAEREAYRWGWFLAGGDESKIQVLDEHQWRVGRTRVHLVPSQVREIPLAAELWVGVCWGPDGKLVATGVLLDKYKALGMAAVHPKRSEHQVRHEGSHDVSLCHRQAV